MKALIQKRKLNLRITLSFGKMKIDKEKFNKLKQLDRIEFRQKFDIIRRINFSIGGYAIYCLILFAIFFVGYEVTGKINLFSVASRMILLMFYILLIELISLIGFSFIRKKKYRELQEEYFKVEVKK